MDQHLVTHDPSDFRDPFDPFPALLDLDLKVLKMYPRIKNVLGQGFQKLEPEQDRQTNTETDATERITSPYTRLQIIIDHLWSKLKNISSVLLLLISKSSTKYKYTSIK